MLMVNYILDGQDGLSPANHKDFTLDLNFDRNDPDARVSANNKWRWIDKRAAQVTAYRKAGLTGDVGVFECMPLDIIISDGAESYKVKQMVDLTTAQYNDDNDIETDSIDRGRADWMNAVGDSITFEYLHEKTTFLPKTSFISMPYVINSIPDYQSAFIALLSTVFIVNELSRSIADITATISVISSNPFQAADAIRLAIQVIYAITLIIALIKLIKDLIDLLIQPVKYHSCCLVKTQLQAACAYWGLKFQSTIFDDPFWSRLCIMPRKLQNPVSTTNKKLLGFLTPDKNSQKGFFDGTPGDLIRIVNEMFNAKTIVGEGKMIIEREDYTLASASYVIPDLYQPFFSTNANEIKSNYLIEFATDVQDKNTIQEYDGTITQIITTPKKVVNKDCVLLKGLEQRNIQLARAKRKKELNKVEEIVADFLKVVTVTLNAIISPVNSAINVINKIGDAIEAISKVLKLIGINLSFSIPNIPSIPTPNLEKVINDRVGMMIIETDFFSVPRAFVFKAGTKDRDNKIDPDNDAKLNSSYLWANFHFIRGFPASTTKPNGNQWLRKRIQSVPFTYQDFKKVLNNNRIFDAQGNVAKIETCKWNVWKQTADIEYRINKLYTKNLQLTIHDPKGY